MIEHRTLFCLKKKLQRKQLSRQSYLQQQNTLKAFERVRMRILEKGALSFHPNKFRPTRNLAEIAGLGGRRVLSFSLNYNASGKKGKPSYEG